VVDSVWLLDEPEELSLVTVDEPPGVGMVRTSLMLAPELWVRVEVSVFSLYEPP
jgi:hypothetical protein